MQDKFPIQFSNTILLKNCQVQFPNTSPKGKSPIQAANNIFQYSFYACPSPPQLLPVDFLLLLLWSWQLVSKKTVCLLYCQSLRHLYIQSFFPATSKVANPMNFITLLHKGPSPQKMFCILSHRCPEIPLDMTACSWGSWWCPWGSLASCIFPIEEKWSFFLVWKRGP